MDEGKFSDEIWDEHKWEAHLNEMERKSEQFRKFIEADSSRGVPRWLTLLNENNNELDAFDAFIEEELEIEDMLYPEDFEDDMDDEEWDDEYDELFYDEEWEDDEFFDDDYTDDFDEGEEWKALSDEFTLSNNGSIETLSVYNRARELAVHILQWAEEIRSEYKNPVISEFVSNSLIIGAKLAGGYSFGFEQDLLGGNIACTKKALNAANSALQLLENDIKNKPFVSMNEYQYLHSELYELRNDIGIYIQELRERFNFGL